MGNIFKTWMLFLHSSVALLLWLRRTLEVWDIKSINTGNPLSDGFPLLFDIVLVKWGAKSVVKRSRVCLLNCGERSEIDHAMLLWGRTWQLEPERGGSSFGRWENRMEKTRESPYRCPQVSGKTAQRTWSPLSTVLPQRWYGKKYEKFPQAIHIWMGKIISNEL